MEKYSDVGQEKHHFTAQENEKNIFLNGQK